ncbi:hypothetical protein T492DRAFT_1138774, partial [Pavlovales sp. CCMP2436]
MANLLRLSRTPRVVSVQSLSRLRAPPVEAVRFLADELSVRMACLARQLRGDVRVLEHTTELAATLEHAALDAAALGERVVADAPTGAAFLRELCTSTEVGSRALVSNLRELARDVGTGAEQRRAVQSVSVRSHRQLVAQRVLIAHLTKLVDSDDSAEPLCAPACDLSA